MSYRYINVTPKSAAMDVVADPLSEYSQGVTRETRIASAAPELLAAVQLLLSLHIAHHNAPEHVAARAAVTYATEQA